jgi:fluoroquinolone transport system permease protein
MALSILLTVIIFPLAGLERLGVSALLVAVAAAPLAPMMALVLAVFAGNKVQGFAVIKGLGVVLPAPLIAYFVNQPWTVVLGVVPTYWPSRLYWALLSGESSWWIWLAAGLAYQSLLVGLLVRQFNRVSGRSSD